MKNILLGLSMAAVSLGGLAAGNTAEARDHRYHDRAYDRGYERVYVSPRQVVYIRGTPYHRNRNIALHVVRNRYGDPVSYYFVNGNRHDRNDYRRYDRRHRGIDRFHDRDNVTIIYRN